MSKFIKTKFILVFLTLGALLFSFYLMFHTFSYDSARQEMKIASKAWSDFGAHIPLIRSFSYGPNLDRLLRLQQIESPLFPGEPIRYHFGFYALVGALERLGVRIDWALNLPSALGFFLLLVLIFWFSYQLFKNYALSFLSVLFFLFNGSLSFFQFFKTHSITEILTNSRFSVFGPWDGGPITAFWTLNIYTNQRHLALSYAIILIILLIRNKPVFSAFFLSTLLFLNYPAAAIAALFLLFRLDFRTILLSLPAIFILSRYTNLSSHIAWQPGYVAHDNIGFFWLQNLGAHAVLIPLGVLVAPKSIRRALILPLSLLFILPNLFRFSPDMINNHKFFNFFLIIGNMFSAYALVILANRLRSFIGVLAYLFIGLLVVLSTLSGVIDLPPVIHDSKGGIPDPTVNPDAYFFATQTKPHDVVANSTWFYHPASIAGRSLYSGYTYFTWSYGYDQGGRERLLESIYRAPNQLVLCEILQKTRVAVVELNKNPEAYLKPNMNLWNALVPVYENPDTGLRIFSTIDVCEK